ncbi:MAG: choice-of-anchor D domain-containing protein [Myxococcota bacterium]
MSRGGLLCVALLLMTQGCQCFGDLLTPAVPVVQVTTGEDAGVEEMEPGRRYALDLGLVELGTRREHRIEIRNLGQAGLEIDEVSFEGPDASRFEAEPATLSIAAGSAALLDVTFQPAEVGEAAAVLSFETNDEKAARIEVEISADVFVPEVAVAPRELDFGDVPVGSRLNLDVEVSSRSTEPLVIVIRPVEPASMGEVFTVDWPGREDGDKGFGLGVGESKKLEIEFAPQLAGRQQAWLEVGACEGCPHISVSLVGNAVASALVVEPSVLDMGAVNPGCTVVEPVRFRNLGHTALELTSLTLSSLAGGEPDPAFAPAGEQAPREIGPRAEVEVEVSFTPPDMQGREARLNWRSSDPRNPEGFVTLLGRGGGPGIELTPRMVSFGQVALGTSVTRTVVISNPGYETTEIRDIEVDGDAFSLVSIPALPISLETGEVRAIEISFSPASSTREAGSLVVHSNVRHEPEAEVELAGFGLDLEPCSYTVLPSALHFGLLPSGDTMSLPLVLSNSGNEPCLVRDLDLSSGSSPAFSLATGQVDELMLEPGETHRVDVLFEPQEEGEHEGELVFLISEPAEPWRRLPVRGSAGEPSILLLPDLLDFGVVGAACPLRTRRFCVANDGSLPVTITGAEVAGSAGQDVFVMLGLPEALANEGVSVAPAARECMQVSYEPVEAGEHADMVVIGLAEREAPLVLPLIGTASADGGDGGGQGYGCLHGRVCAPSGDRWLPGAEVRLTLEDDGGAETFSTTTDEAGYFTLQAVPAGLHQVVVEKGAFSAEHSVEILDGRVTRLEEGLCVDAASARVAVISPSAPYTQRLEDALDRLGIHYDVYQDSYPLLGDAQKLATYDIVMLDSGHWVSAIISEETRETEQANLQAFVEAGGRFYASDYRGGILISRIWRDLVLFLYDEEAEFLEYQLVATITLPELAASLGRSTVEIWLEEPKGEFPLLHPDVEVWLTGSVDSERWDDCYPCPRFPGHPDYGERCHSCRPPPWVGAQWPATWPECRSDVSCADPQHWCLPCRGHYTVEECCPDVLYDCDQDDYAPLPDDTPFVFSFEHGLGRVVWSYFRVPDQLPSDDKDLIIDFLIFQL